MDENNEINEQAKRPKKKRTSVSVPPEDLGELQRIAEQKRVSVGWVVREAIGQYLSANRPLFRSLQ